jgi:hypothetical protein
MPPSLNTEPGDVAALPGVPPPLASVVWQLLLWGLGSAYAGDAPMTAMATMHPAENSLCLMFTLRFRARTIAYPAGDTMSMGFWFKPVCAAGV